MSKLEFNEKGFSYLRDVTLTYNCLNNPQYKYESTTEKEYSIEVTMDAATHKEWKKIFKKNTCREIDTADYEKYKKVPVPFPEQEEQFVYRFKLDEKFSNDYTDKQGNQYKAGDLVPKSWRPTVLLPKGDGTNEDITWTKKVANGSKADVAFIAKKNSYGGLSIKLNSILVTDFIEFESSGGGAFGAVVSSDAGASQGTPTQTTNDDDGQDFDDSIPF
jgi:hypothetical protein